MSFLSSAIGHFVNFIVMLSHAVNVLLRNFILIAFVLAFAYGIFRLAQNGWRYLRGRPMDSAPRDGGD
ncbi:MAG TPA: hypothetical protein VEK34_09475 [Methylocella sp.]|nr:hypothetical protein [Methylocella sp.]